MGFPYTHAERKMIVDYIIKNQGFYELRGTLFWKKMQQQKVLDRTWQSIKEHFRMNIINNLRVYNISREDERKIRTGYHNTKCAERTTEQTTQHAPEDNNFDFSDEEKSNQISTSSDNSDNLVAEIRPNPGKKVFKKQIVVGSSRIKDVSDELTKNKRVWLSKKSRKQTEVASVDDIEPNDPIDVPSTSSISYNCPESRKQKKGVYVDDIEPNNPIDVPSTSSISYNCPESRKQKKSVYVDDIEPNNPIDVPSTSSISYNCPESRKQKKGVYVDDIEPNNPIDVPSTSSISNVNSNNCPNLKTAFTEADDIAFLKAITKYHSNLLTCDCVVTFIKNYTDLHNLCQDWTKLYDRFIEMLNHLQLYDFLSPEIVLQLQKIKEPLEIYRSNGFQYSQNEVLSIKVRQETVKVTLKPNPDVIYLKQEDLELLNVLENHRNMIYTLTEGFITDQISHDSVTHILKKIGEFQEKYLSKSCINNNQNAGELPQDVKEEVLDETVVIKEEIDVDVDNQSQSNISETIPVQPQISLNLSEIENNNVQNSQYLESLTTEDEDVTNIVEKFIENNSSESDMEFLTCET